VSGREQAGFDLGQLALLQTALGRSETLVARGFRIPALPSQRYPYELVTLVDLKGPERAEEALAHLVIYARDRPRGTEHLYRICLQDDLILHRVAQNGREDGLEALLIYILTHELVHVVRFQRDEGSFMAAPEARQSEEAQVHQLTLALLEEGSVPHWERLDKLCGNPVQVVVLPGR
jgi:hypothetical protein